MEWNYLFMQSKKCMSIENTHSYCQMKATRNALNSILYLISEAKAISDEDHCQSRIKFDHSISGKANKLHDPRYIFSSKILISFLVSRKNYFHKMNKQNEQNEMKLKKKLNKTLQTSMVALHIQFTKCKTQLDLLKKEKKRGINEVVSLDLSNKISYINGFHFYIFVEFIAHRSS